MLWGLKPVEQKAAHGLALESIRRSIFLGLLLPDERMASERRLAEQIGISRVTLREALSVLESEGFIKIKRGASGGAFVASENALRQMAENQASAQTTEVLRITEFREHVEPMAARLAAIRRSPADLKQIDEALSGLTNATSLGEVRQGEAAFHLSVARASGNRFLADGLEDAMGAVLLPFPLGDVATEARSSLPLRQAVAGAIRGRNEQRASDAMTAALVEDRKRLPSRQVA